MAIQFKCSCGHVVKARDEHAGKLVRCPACGSAATVPTPPLPQTSPPPLLRMVPPPLPAGAGQGADTDPCRVVFRPTVRVGWPERCVGCFVGVPAREGRVFYSVEALHADEATRAERAREWAAKRRLLRRPPPRG